MTRGAVFVLGILAIVGGIGLGMLAALVAGPHGTPAGSGLVAALSSTPPSAAPPVTPPPSTEGSASTVASAPPATTPTPTPSTGPALVANPLTGLVVTPDVAARHPPA